MPVIDPPAGANRRPGFLGAALVLLALWGQLLAPTANLRTALALADPLSAAVICGRADGAAAATAERSAPAPAGCGPCLFCCVGLATPGLPAAPEIGRAVAWSMVAWPIPAPLCTAARPRPIGQPRAPPSLA